MITIIIKSREWNRWWCKRKQRTAKNWQENCSCVTTTLANLTKPARYDHAMINMQCYRKCIRSKLVILATIFDRFYFSDYKWKKPTRVQQVNDPILVSFIRLPTIINTSHCNKANLEHPTERTLFAQFIKIQLLSVNVLTLNVTSPIIMLFTLVIYSNKRSTTSSVSIKR